MPLRSYKATSPGLRQMTRSTFEEITTKEPHKPLLEPQIRGSGRNNAGRLTVRHRGGGDRIPIACLCANDCTRRHR
jgi:large subunit ribosomal protein L2